MRSVFYAFVFMVSTAFLAGAQTKQMLPFDHRRTMRHADRDRRASRPEARPVRWALDVQLACADVICLFNGKHEYAAVSNFASASGLDDRFNAFVDEPVFDDDFDHHLG